MAPRVGIALAIFFGIASTASAQVVRFETSVGSFDMVLNPEGLPVLQAHVDNLLHYIENGNYNGSWINRAGNDPDTGEDFVLQMGGFFSQTVGPPMTRPSARRVNKFAPVLGEPARETGLTNEVGTVAMALGRIGGNGPTDQNSGTSEFFINVRNNSFLDADFTVFARVSDMATVKRIMSLPDVNLAAAGRQPPFAGDSTTFGDVPVQENGDGVFITRAFVVTDTISAALAISKVESAMALSAASSASAAPVASVPAAAAGDGASSLLRSSLVPEPTSLLMGLIAVLSASLLVGRRRRS
jgi:cyclophilin family peptidyl-prolyl cis-trans isomerase